MPQTSPTPADLDSIYREHRQFLWGLTYRLTGSTADADDIVQETFVKAIENPPPDTARPWRPWLVRVATNLGIDRLRRRKESPYPGPWLPAVIETAPGDFDLADTAPTPDGRYTELESVTLAFLLALEALNPKQRAVLILRDVFDYSVAETAQALEISESDVKTTHHRARGLMETYDHARVIPTRALQQKVQVALGNFLSCLMNRDAAGIEKLLAADVRVLSDGGGEYSAARVPIVGAAKVAKFYVSISEQKAEGMNLQLTYLNGLPAIVIRTENPEDGTAPVLVWQCVIDQSGKIKEFHSVMATEKVLSLK